MRAYLLLVTVLFLSCKEKTDEKIVLTSGFSEDPDEPRIGVEIRNNELYHCKEDVMKKGTYTYYYSKLDPNVFQSFKDRVKKTFKKVNTSYNVIDGTPYELIYIFDETSDSIRFFTMNLTASQINVVSEVLSLENYKFQKITYHSFPTGLLNEKLPKPPPIKSIN